jgi:propanol-preferring alcohol dehydrogenase
MMRAMVLETTDRVLRERELPKPEPEFGQVLVRVGACGVCRTDLHIVDGELPRSKLPLIPGHEVVGRISKLGPGVNNLIVGERVGIPWLGHTCGFCRLCQSGHENLCEQAQFVGYNLNGGYADYIVADQQFCFRIDSDYSDVEAAPLLCAGLIGYRSLRRAGDPVQLGIYGFGAAAHIITQLARFEKRNVYAFTRPGDVVAQNFALELGAVWSGPSDTLAPDPLDAAIIFAPVGALIPVALRAVRPGGRVVCAGIHMSNIPSFPYEILWREREIVSVANLTRNDGREFLSLAPKVPIRTAVEVQPLTHANEALAKLRDGNVLGALVLIPNADV